MLQLRTEHTRPGILDLEKTNTGKHIIVFIVKTKHNTMVARNNKQTT